MFLSKISLKNIRSYEKLDIEFNVGTTLLSGDIGSGKTTILMAIEFALFGILRGKTSPQELLRHGKDDGFVRFAFSIKGNNVVITRQLKRTSNGINQTAGSIIVNDHEEKLVATELKARILELLGYPQSLLAKSTNLFRFTVYTPQEQVKLILSETMETRKDIIRKIFDLDKYKRVSQNITPYISFLREKIERYKGQTDDIQLLRDQMGSRENELEKMERSKIILAKTFDELKIKTEKLQKTIDELEKKEKEYQSKIHTIKITEEGIKNKKGNITMLKRQQNDIESKMQMKLNPVVFDAVKKQKAKTVLLELSKKKTLLAEKKGELIAHTKQISELTSRIENLTTCPTCRQDVSIGHKEHIKNEQKINLEKIKTRDEKLITAKNMLNEKEDKLRQLIERLENDEKKYTLYLHEKKMLDERKKQLERMLINIAEQENHISKLNVILENYKIELKKFTPVDIKHEKMELLYARREERSAELELQKLITREEISKKQLKEIYTAIDKKEKLKQMIVSLNSIKTWTQDMFIPLLQTMEKKVMTKVHREFNALFTSWFTTLIEDETMQVRLDESFTPMIEQNGYDTNIENLSGGEKTSVALAYRLALNKVLNDYFSTIHTKDLLILDEPTDGFSAEQLDRLKIVLKQVNAKQVIIVSHEEKMEALADNIVRLEKSQHTSNVMG